MEPAEGILIQDIDADRDSTDTEDIDSLDKTRPSSAGDQGEGPQQALRDQLKRSLSHKVTTSGQHYIPQLVTYLRLLVFTLFQGIEISRSHSGTKNIEIQDLDFNNGGNSPVRCS